MSHNRINPDRFKEERRYGYDPITNISYEGRLGVKPAPLRQEDSKPVWSRLHGGSGYTAKGPSSGISKPRDLSGATPQSIKGSNVRMNSGRRVMGGATNRDSKIASQNITTMGVTQKPEFVPSLTIPSEGMVDGKLNL